MLRSIPALFLLALLLTGCVLPGAFSAPTPYPPEYIPTVIFLTAQSINAATSAARPTPTAIPTGTATAVLPTIPLPTVTFTPRPGVPLAAIQINAPGPMSRISSPLELHAMVVPGESHRVEVDLFGEDGRLLGRTLLVVSGYAGGTPISVKMPFEIRAAGETGTLQISTRDLHGRVQSLNTVRILLLSAGASQVNPPGNMIYERVAFYNLQPDAHISGGVLSVKGSYSPINDRPVVLELATADGKTIAQRLLSLSVGDSQFFDTTLPFKVTRETAARLYLYQDDDVISGRGYIYSQPLALEP